MIKLQRLGRVLEPETPEVRTLAKFNAGMTLAGDIVHMAYRYTEWRPAYDARCQSNYAVDEIRYARLTPTGTLVYESHRPLIAPSLPWDGSGCQDARVIPFEDAYYLIYCGWDKDTAPAGRDRPRVGVAYTTDFVTCEKLGLIDHYTWDKDACIFPERIDGKIAFIHRVEPNIQIDYFDSFEQLLDPASWEHYQQRVEAATVLRAAQLWEGGKVGAGAPPLKTPLGWLLIYHAVESFPDRPGIYRAGAALLDLHHPSRVLARLPYPILEPETDYEQCGDVDHVVFPVGAYVYQGELYVSYGAADRCVALAKAPLDHLLEELSQYMEA
jgi:beta-1,2-mannobiose phosphorylase / 1,2-beta-oligomannan phosphorylase